MSDLERLEEILNATFGIVNFDDSFVVDMEERITNGRSLTIGQSLAIENIYSKWVK